MDIEGVKKEYQRFHEELSKLARKRSELLFEYGKKMDEEKIKQIKRRLHGRGN